VRLFSSNSSTRRSSSFVVFLSSNQVDEVAIVASHSLHEALLLTFGVAF